ncbi:hypothetical protein B0G76_2181 [Paraburkholderia sp. BL23I1N1]|nr:hypothetical protein B0G76_2181 [Paraburkholderia sp. BL23I1N1]
MLEGCRPAVRTPFHSDSGLWFPWIQQWNAGSLKVFYVTGHYRHAMRKCRRGNDRIALRARIRNMQPGAAKGDNLIERQDPTRELREHLAFEPSAQGRTLYGVFPLPLQNAEFQFKHGDRGKKLRGGWYR